MTAKVSQFVKDTLVQAGFVVHGEKSHWEPSSTVRWLGFMIDTFRSCLVVPSEKIELLEERLRSASTIEYIPPSKGVGLINGDIDVDEPCHWSCQPIINGYTNEGNTVKMSK